MNDIRKEDGNFLMSVYEFLICAYIILAPINNSFNTLSIFSTNVLILTVILLLCTSFLLLFNNIQGNNNFFSNFVLIVFLFEIAIQIFSRESITNNHLFTILLYISFLKISPVVSLKKVYSAFYISVIISAGFTLYFGNFGGSVSETATMVDGSIAPIVLALILFLNEEFEKTKNYNMIKTIALFSSGIVALYGMSRSRLVIMACMIGLKFFINVFRSLMGETINIYSFLQLAVIIAVLLFAFSTAVSEVLFETIFARFKNGFSSDVRDAEIQAGIQFFKDNLFLGTGWGEIYYFDYDGYYRDFSNHCMYTSILGRGGLLMALAFAASFISVIKKVFKSKSTVCIVLTGIFFLLAYGNAGLFNYTICSLFIPLILILKQNDSSIYTTQTMNS